MLKTPVLFLIFNRPDVTKRVFDSIKHVKPEQLYIAADGPRTEEEKSLCEETRKVALDNIDWDCEVKTLFRDENLGIRYGVISGIDWFFNNVEQGIILEDDCLPDVSFFYFCEELLEKYKDNTRVISIGGNSLQKGIKRGNASYYFSTMPHIWGWATWRCAWLLNDKYLDSLESNIQTNFFQNVFEEKKHQDFWINTLTRIKQNNLVSWAFVWVYSSFINNGLNVVPNKNLVSNIGFNQNATNCREQNNPLGNLKTYSIKKLKHPKAVKANKKADIFNMNTYFTSCKKNDPPKTNKIIREIKRAYNKLFKLQKKVPEDKPVCNLPNFNCLKSETSVIYKDAKIINNRDKEAVKIGEHTHIRGELLTFGHGGHITIGDYCYVGDHTRIWSAEKIEIGNKVLIAHDVFIVDSKTHPLDPEARHEQFKILIDVGLPKEQKGLDEKPIIIRDNAWICSKAIILPGIIIGEGAVIGAGSVVTKNVESYTVVAGNPAKFIKKVELNEINR